MPVEIIPGAPEKVRLFWQAYFWILVSTLLALPFLKPTRAQLGTSLAQVAEAGAAPGAGGGRLFRHRLRHQPLGQGARLDAGRSQTATWSTCWLRPSAATFGELYPLVAPFLGLLGGFISGSETSSIAMLTALHLQTAERIGADGLLIAAASGIGGGLASVISPAKLQNASAAIDRIGEEAQVLRTTFVIALVITAVCAVMALIWAF